ncbi:MAG: carboxymuconolactone decarboxylase family protein [Rhodomicrobium sp.]
MLSPASSCRHGNLDIRTRLMVQLASMIACQALRKYRVMLGAALTIGVTPIEAKEIVYQAVPYALGTLDLDSALEHKLTELSRLALSGRRSLSIAWCSACVAASGNCCNLV